MSATTAQKQTAEAPKLTTPAVLSRNEIRQRTALQIPNPEAGREYRWAAMDAGHPQSFARFRLEGYEIVPASKARKLGLDGFKDPTTGDEVTPSSSNFIQFGNLLLMDCSTENYQRILREKQAAFGGFQSIEKMVETLQEEQKEELAELQDTYLSAKR